MRVVVLFMKGVLSLHPIWQLWVGILLALNAVIPWLFLDRPEAAVVLAVFGVVAALMAYLTHRVGFTRLLGAAHAPWIPLVAWLATRTEGVDAGTGYGWWLWGVIVVDGLSVVIDAADVLRWLRGERAPLVTLERR